MPIKMTWELGGLGSRSTQVSCTHCWVLLGWAPHACLPLGLALPSLEVLPMLFQLGWGHF